MALHFKLQRVVVADSHEQVSVDELIVLTKDHEQLEHMGLNLAEGQGAPAGSSAPRRQPPDRRVPGLAHALPDLRSKPWRQGSPGHLLPHLVRQAGAGEPAVASLSVSAR